MRCCLVLFARLAADPTPLALLRPDGPSRRRQRDHGPQHFSCSLSPPHRPTNVDNPRIFAQLLDALEVIQRDLPIVFPIHPRTRKSLTENGLAPRMEAMPGLRPIDPAGYPDFLKLLSHARIVLTDSGGIQEETTILKVPCLTLRENTERPVTAQVGSNRVVGTDPA
jgi:UDP-N-acetylglucosamine 2-epimerase (non-hydrolysing)